MYAAQFGNFELVSLLVENGADINVVNMVLTIYFYYL